MKLAIVGYGRMGREIERIAEARCHDAISIDPNAEADFKDINDDSMKDVDVAIDFTLPASVLKNAALYNKYRVNAVIGTTGWYDRMQDMKKSTAGIGLIWSGNFSIGVNAFFRVIDSASRIINKIDAYDISAYEMHHKGKADSPSGTAKMLADILLRNIERKKQLVVDKLDRKIEDYELHFASIRGGSNPGTHSIMFDSDADTIEIIHRARGRSGFAAGAVMAAEWLKGKKGFFSIDDFMNGILDSK